MAKNRCGMYSKESYSHTMTNDAISTLFRTNEEVLLALQACVTAVNANEASTRAVDEEMKAKDRQIQELKGELEKCRAELEEMKAKAQRRKEIHEALIREEVKHKRVINHKRRICNNSRELHQELKEELSIQGLPEDLRVEAKEKMEAAKKRFDEVHAEIKEEERKYEERVKSLKDELKALDG